MGSDEDEREVVAVRPAEAVVTPTTQSVGEQTTERKRRPPRAEIEPGTTVGRYTILECLGRGGMGEVHLAHDPKLDRKLALKLIRDEREQGPQVELDRERMRREAQALARLSHPNVVTVYDVGQWEGRIFIAMELVDGQNLSRWLRNKPRTVGQIVRVFLEAGRGLAAAHAADIVHRDFKPANVMVGRDGRICVLDFGLAIAARQRVSPGDPISAVSEVQDDTAALTETGHTVGTPPYMAPEQHLGGMLDARSDQYSFCVSLFEALAGQRPFPGRDASLLLRAKLDERVTEPPQAERIPGWIRELLDRGLARDPGERHASMEVLLRALERGYRAGARRRRRAWIGGAVLGTAVVGGAWWGLSAPDPCAHGRERAATSWSTERAADVERSFAASSLPYSAESFGRVRARLDGWSDAWAEAYRSSCLALRANDGEAAALDVRMRCLDDQLERFDATVLVLAQADADTVRRAPQVIASLPELDRCLRESSVAEDVARPEPDEAAEVTRLRRRLATAAVLETAGRYREGLAMAREVLEQAKPLRYAALRVEALQQVGSLTMLVGDHVEAEKLLGEAAVAAQGLGYDRVAIAAMVDLVLLLGEHLSRPEEAMTWAGHAHAALQRSPDPATEAKLLASEAVVDIARGDYEKARERAEQALQLRMEVLGKHHADLIGSHNNLANALRRLGRIEAAIAHYERALALAEANYGRDHPLTATLLQNLGGLLAEHGDLVEAEAPLRRSLEIRRRSLGPRHPEVATALNNLGGLAWQKGEGAQARAMLTEALDIQRELLGPDDVKNVILHHNLAEMCLQDGELDEAYRHAREAKRLLERHLESDHPRWISTLVVLGRIAAARGQLDEAREQLGLAIATAEKDFGPRSPNLGDPLQALGEIELDYGRPEAAREVFARAVAIREAAGQPRRETALLRYMLAEARIRCGESRTELQGLLDEARADADELQRGQIDRWLAANPG